MHVVVIGAGLGGLAATVAADRAGHTVTVLERASALRETGAGIGIMPNGVLALDALGLGAPVRAQAGPADGGGMRDRHGNPLLTADLAAVQERAGAPLVVVRRSWLHGLLVDALAPGTVLTGTPVTSLRDAGDHVELRTGGGPVHADAVVVADGAHSKLRAALLPDHPGLAGSGEHAARAIAPAAPAGVPLLMGEFIDHRTGDRFGCLPLVDGGVYWYATWRGPSPADPVDRHRWLRDRRAGWHPATVALIDATPADAVHVVETEQLVHPLPTLRRPRRAARRCRPRDDARPRAGRLPGVRGRRDAGRRVRRHVGVRRTGRAAGLRRAPEAPHVRPAARVPPDAPAARPHRVAGPAA
jgi:2-polyprenyl-6-methoxyphenol hydroxylase-like FAD-dependent oxidoreductase